MKGAGTEEKQQAGCCQLASVWTLPSPSPTLMNCPRLPGEESPLLGGVLGWGDITGVDRLQAQELQVPMLWWDLYVFYLRQSCTMGSPHLDDHKQGFWSQTEFKSWSTIGVKANLMVWLEPSPESLSFQKPNVELCILNPPNFPQKTKSMFE